MNAYEKACLEGRPLFAPGRCAVNGCIGDRIVTAEVIGTSMVTFQLRCTSCRRESWMPEWEMFDD